MGHVDAPGRFGAFTHMSDVMPISEARRQLGALVDRAYLGHEPVYLSKRGRRVVVLVDADEYDRLLELAEDAAGAEAAANARRQLEETAATPIPWEEVEAELGLTSDHPRVSQRRRTAPTSAITPSTSSTGSIAAPKP